VTVARHGKLRDPNRGILARTSLEGIPQGRDDLDTTIAAMALTAKEMNAKYKETSEGGLAVSVVLC
jgi:L-serine deaminase